MAWAERIQVCVYFWKMEGGKQGERKAGTKEGWEKGGLGERRAGRKEGREKGGQGVKIFFFYQTFLNNNILLRRRRLGTQTKLIIAEGYES